MGLLFLCYTLRATVHHIVAIVDSREEARNSLHLSGSRKLSLGGWIEQAMFFYKVLLENPAFIAAMTLYSYDQIKLEAENARVNAVINARSKQNTERGQAQEATKTRDAKMDELDRWIAEYNVSPLKKVQLLPIKA